MELNAAKFEHLCYGKNDYLKSVSIYMSTIVPILKKKKVNDLGVLMANNCLFKDHINKVETKARCISGWILRTFASKDKDLILTLYISLVISIVDYCSVCSTHQRTDTKVEMIQRQFTMKIYIPKLIVLEPIKKPKAILSITTKRMYYICLKDCRK